MATLIEIVRASGLAALIATHNLDLARRLDRIVALEDGELRDGYGARLAARSANRIAAVVCTAAAHSPRRE